MDQGPEAARDFVQGFVSARLEDEPCVCLWLLDLPALRERVGDILSLAEYFLGIYSQRLDLPVPLISDAAQRVLELHSWPGNTRELENVIHFALLVSSGDEILPEHLNLPVAGSPLEQVQRIFASASAAERQTLLSFLNEQQLHEQNGISK